MVQEFTHPTLHQKVRKGVFSVGCLTSPDMLANTPTSKFWMAELTLISTSKVPVEDYPRMPLGYDIFHKDN
jgi:hypothetical protein